MRRFLRILFNSVTLLSLALCVVTIMLCVAAPVDLVRGRHAGRWVFLGVYGGSVTLSVADREPQIGEAFGPATGSWMLGIRSHRMQSVDGANVFRTFRAPYAV